MPLVKEQKDTIIADFRAHDVDTGSSEVQIALLSARINYLTEHFKTHKKDHERYQRVIARLGIRR
jgi:small subunit ribosomal protein S15